MTSNAIFYEWDHNANAYTRRPANVTGYDTRTTVQPLTGGKLGNVTVRIAQIDVDYGNVVGQPAQPERVISTVAHTLQELNAQKGKNYYELIAAPAATAPVAPVAPVVPTVPAEVVQTTPIPTVPTAATDGPPAPPKATANAAPTAPKK